MALQRVKHYIRRAEYDDGTFLEHTIPFNGMQASQVDAVLSEKGLILVKANMLIEKWNRLGQQGISPKYYYRLEF